MNKSTHVLVTRAESPGNTVKKKIVSLDLPEGGSPRYLENGYTFHLENLSLGILESRKENEGWYFMSLEENFSVRHFCLQLRLYGNNRAPPVRAELGGGTRDHPLPKDLAASRNQEYPGLGAT